eukprot:173836_1
MNSSHEQKHEHSTAQDKNDVIKPIITRIRRSQNALNYSEYERRLCQFEEKTLFRQNTIYQLKKETKQPTISLIQPQLQISETLNILKTHDPLNGTEWQKYLISIHNDLSNKVPYFESIDKEMNFDTSECNIDVYVMERTLMQQMKYWIERYGIPAMVAHQEVYQLKNDLINAIEETDQLDEESVQLTQKVFTKENEIQMLKYEQHKLYQKINELNELNRNMKQKYEYENSDDIPPPPPPPIQYIPQPPPILSRSCNNLFVQK